MLREDILRNGSPYLITLKSDVADYPKISPGKPLNLFKVIPLDFVMLALSMNGVKHGAEPAHIRIDSFSIQGQNVPLVVRIRDHDEWEPLSGPPLIRVAMVVGISLSTAEPDGALLVNCNLRGKGMPLPSGSSYQ